MVTICLSLVMLLLSRNEAHATVAMHTDAQLDTSHGSIVGLNAGAQFDTSSVASVAASKARLVRLNFIVTKSQSGTRYS